MRRIEGFGGLPESASAVLAKAVIYAVPGLGVHKISFCDSSGQTRTCRTSWTLTSKLRPSATTYSRPQAGQFRFYFMNDRDFQKLLSYLKRLPAMSDSPISTGKLDDGNWWVKFSLDITHPLAWHVVQELACVLNYLSVNERLPTVFIPVSPAPYLNGGPEEYLSWVIESKDPAFKPGTLANWLEERLPKPVDDPDQWAEPEDE